MPAIFFALISYLGWGSGDIFGTIATRKIGAYSTSLWTYIFGFILSSLYIPIAVAELGRLTPGIFILNVFLGIVSLIGFVLFTEGLRVGNASLVGTIAASFASLVVVLSIIFLGEKVNVQQIIAILIIFIGLILSSSNFNEFKKGFVLDRGTLLAILTMLCWGIYFTFIKIPIKEIGWFWPNYISLATFPLLVIYTKLRRIKVHNPLSKNVLFPLLAASVLVTSGSTSYNLAASMGLISIVAPIAGSYPTLFVVLAFLVFKDKIARQQIAGIITTLLGLVLLSIFSV